MRPAIRRAVVVIPARDEAATLDACLASVEAAGAIVDVPTDIVLVLDACTDDSAAIAARHPAVRTVAVAFGNVGRSRAHGVETALAGSPHDAQSVWLAFTDGDGTVPRGWLAEHLRAARHADAYTGAVIPVLDDLDAERRRVWEDRHPPGATLGHVHGANLGMRASAYLRAGGFPPLATAEDVRLAARLRDAGVLMLSSEHEPVVTSARLRGRAPEGYAGYLEALAADRERGHGSVTFGVPSTFT
ncbi:glycosyltransferase [Leifsonia sp. 21MFCrub1.1]|uniref:glycosyltransferase n=1 Tax=Leifsonia sp. 21MFCrub1.1 TaxID=1798223 RepID=UPI00089281A5|nr:glycosyltransferase [Leifsonia sp. 21MFCrub1.1]SEA97517.1 Glycosyl transferase family 2 [Leifsonia sp. 21MFCrub1.1]